VAPEKLPTLSAAASATTATTLLLGFFLLILLAPLAEGKQITTVEGLGGNHPVQEAFVEAEAFQCGYCTPGMILTAKRLLEEDPEPTEERIRNYMGGNLCRCGCYAKIEDAVNLAASARKATAPSKGGA
jgi:aerobic-type carbon monoxide dehydrogenase small subunit (CoxS/CutS family)